MAAATAAARSGPDPPTTARRRSPRLPPPPLPREKVSPASSSPSTPSTPTPRGAAAAEIRRPSRDRANFAPGAVALALAALPTPLLLALSLVRGDGEVDLPPQLDLDHRSLALGRAALGALVLLDLSERVRDSGPFYSDSGVCPRSTVLSGGDPRLRPTDMSLYFSAGSEPVVAALMVMLGGTSAVCLTAGRKTRLAAFGCWAHWRSLEVRCGPVHQAGDTAMRLLLWWAMFLPLGSAYSLDGADSGAGPIRQRQSSATSALAAFGLVIQMSHMYLFSALVKVDPCWYDGTAVRLVLSNFGFAREPFSGWVLSLPSQFTAALTRATWWAEMLVLPLLLSPLYPNAARLAAVATFLGFHAGTGLTMRLGLFPAICSAGWIMLIPGCAWDALGVPPATPDRPSARVPPPAPSDWLDALLVGASAVLAARSCLSRLQECAANALSAEGQTAHPAVAWAVARLWRSLAVSRGPRETELCHLLGQNQQWFMFDRPARTDHWFVTAGRRADGTAVDLFASAFAPGASRTYAAAAPEPVLRSPPPPWGVAYRSHRWRKMFLRLSQGDHGALRSEYARYVMGRWNDAARGGGGEVRSVEMLMVRRRIDLTGGDGAERAALLWTYDGTGVR